MMMLLVVVLRRLLVVAVVEPVSLLMNVWLISKRRIDVILEIRELKMNCC